MVGLQPVIFESHDGKNCRKPRSADCHGLPGGQAIWKGNQPIGIDPGLLRKPTPVSFSNPPSGEDDCVARLISRVIGAFHNPRKINPGDVREVSDNSAVSLHAQAILIVDGGVFDFDGDISIGEPVIFQLLH